MKLPLLLVSVLIASPILESSLVAASKGHSTFQPTISSVSSDSITVLTGRTAGAKVKIDGVVQPGSNVETYKITPSTILTVNGLKGSLTDLEKGMTVSVTRGTSLDEASTIVATTHIPELPKPKAKKSNQKKGVKLLKPFDKITNDTVVRVTSDAITIGSPGNNASAYQITPMTLIKLDGKPSDVSAIAKGLPVKIVASGQTTAGTIYLYTLTEKQIEEQEEAKKNAKK